VIEGGDLAVSADVLDEGLLILLGFSGVVECWFTVLPVRAIKGFVFKHEVDSSPGKTCVRSCQRDCCHVQMEQLLAPDNLAHEGKVHLQTATSVPER
jgi:hypothetical protein